MPKKFLEQSGIVRKDFFIAFILLFNAILWLYMTPIIIESVLSDLNLVYVENLIIWATYYIAIIASGIVGSILSNKISRLNLLYLWMILGAVASLFPALLNDFTVVYVLIISILFGASYGLGVPSCWAYFADCTLVENRGRIGGIILLTTNLCAPLFAISFSTLNLVVNSIILAAWRASGLVILFLKPEENFVSEMKKNASFASILHNKSFNLYFVAWLMFCLIDRFEQPILRNFPGDHYSFILIVSPILGSLSAFIGGLLSDRIGRKPVVLYGFLTLGISYAIIGLAPAPLISWYFSVVIGSISTGILWVIFFFIVWGDLSQPGTREKYYVIGAIPFYLTPIIQRLSTSYLTLIPATSAFSLASFFLFLAVLPLLYAPETLPQRKIELRRLKKYIEKAKKIQQKYA